MSSRGLLAVLSLIVIGLLGYRACSGAPGAEVSLPAQLLGVWMTQTPSHADRHLEIRAGEIVFGQGEAGNQKHLIHGVRRRSDDQGHPIYVIRYQVTHLAGERSHPRSEIRRSVPDHRHATGNPMAARALRTSRTRRGMTLVEALIVIALIAVIAALTIPAMVDAMERTRVKRAIGELAGIELELENLQEDLPEDLSELPPRPRIDPWGRAVRLLQIRRPRLARTGAQGPLPGADQQHLRPLQRRT